MSHQNPRGGFSGRSPRSDGHYSHRSRHVGPSKPFEDDSFGSKERMPQRMSRGRGKHSHYDPSGSGSKHFNDKRASNYVYRPKKQQASDVSPNSLEAGGSNMKQPGCLDALDSVSGDDDLHSLSACFDSKETLLDVNRIQIGETQKQMPDDGAILKPDFSGKVKIGYMLEESPLSAKADTEDQAAFQEKGAKNSLEAGGSNMKQPGCLDALDSVGGDDDLHSLSACFDSKETLLDMNRIQIGETPKKVPDDGAILKPDFSGKVKVGYMLEESPLSAIADTEDQAAFQEKGAKNLEGVGYLHFDICPPKTGAPVTLKPSLLVKNRQKRNEIKLSMEGQNRTELRSGMVLLKNYLSLSDQIKIIKACRDRGLGPGGFYQPGYRDGARLHLKMMCLGKNWDPETGNYEDIRLTDCAKPPIIPAEFYQFVSRAIQDSHAVIKENPKVRNVEAELPWMSPTICIVNFYSATGKLGIHKDKDESRESLDKGLPVVSFSIGDSAEFLYGDHCDVDQAQKVKLESGDVLLFGGKSRHIFHGVSTIIPNTAPTALREETNIRPGRLNLTFRQY